jgi:hypothetical protein
LKKEKMDFNDKLNKLRQKLKGKARKDGNVPPLPYADRVDQQTSTFLKAVGPELTGQSSGCKL